MGKRKKKNREQLGTSSKATQEATPENLRIEIDRIFRDFIADPTATVYIFTSDLNNLQRKYIHEKSLKMDLKSRSYGKEPNRQIHIRKKVKAAVTHDVDVELSPPAQMALTNYLSQYNFPDYFRYEQLLTRTMNRARRNRVGEKQYCRIMLSRPPMVQPAKPPEPLMDFQLELPIYAQKSEIVDKIVNNQIVIISSETGSGKSTQIPQYIMDQCLEAHQPCKIVCTQPRRISAVAVAERVADERGDHVGNSTGYHIKLEQHYGAHTNLIYCTNGVLLRTLMQGPQALESFTHIIVDEVHERDRLSDFLLIYLRINRPFFPRLKIILMSATLNVAKFQTYFGDAQVVEVPGRLYPIQTYFLDDILPQLDYMTGEMRRVYSEQGTDADYGRWEDMEGASGASNELNEVFDGQKMDPDAMIDNSLDSYLQQREEGGVIDLPPQMMVYFLSENVSVNYRHSVSGMTTLMIAASLGDFSTVARLLNLGADTDICCNKGLNCMDYAKLNGHIEIYQYLVQRSINGSGGNEKSPEGTPYLLLYDKTHRDDQIDYELIGTLIRYIHKTIDKNVEGSILVFLPGYDDIMACNDVVARYMEGELYRLFYLHSSMTIRDQSAVFSRLGGGQRKIILSTNIAETSITIDDVCFVIDSGRAKEKCYDPNTKTSSLETQFISLSCAKQRAGRAGRTRPGMCFHLMSRHRFSVLDAERAPEMLRTSLAELCLHTKILAPNNMSISEFLNLAPDAPSPTAVRGAIERLCGLGAIFDNEDLTQLGEYLIQLTIEPHLAKILIYSVIFRCLEPILTIVAIMSQKDPFLLPTQANLRQIALEKRKQFADGVLSDHIVLLNVFQRWQEACRKHPNAKFAFCREHFISGSTMDMILETRKQLLAQLRAIGLVNPSQGIGIYNVNSNNWALVKAVLATGLYPNIMDPSKGKLDFPHGVFNKRSVLNGPKKLFIMYDEQVKKVKSAGFYLKGVTAIAPLAIALLVGNQLSHTGQSLSIDDWIEYALPNDELLRLRCKINELVNKVIGNARYFYNNADNYLVQTVADILQYEDEQCELEQPKNVGKRPLFFQKPAEPNAVVNGARNRPNQPNWRNVEQNNRSGDSWRSSPPQQQQQNSQESNSGSSNGSNEPPMRPRSDSLDSNPNDNWRKKIADYQDNPIYILIRPKEIHNVRIAYNTSVWVFAPQTEKKVLKYKEEGKYIYLLFAVDKPKPTPFGKNNKNEAGRSALNGMALFDRMITNGTKKPTAQLSWLFKFDMPYDQISHLYNPYNDNRHIWDCLDGDVIQDVIGKEIYRIYDEFNFLRQCQEAGRYLNDTEYAKNDIEDKFQTRRF